MLKKVIIGVVVVVVLLVGAAVALPFLVPVEKFKDEIAAQITKATGRDVAINGGIELKVYPNILLDVGDIVVANAPGGKAPHLAKIGKVLVNVQLMPLLSKELRVDGIKLVKPDINLEVNAKGQPNWSIEGGEKKAEETPKEAGGSPVALKQLSDIVIEDGRFSYVDRSSGGQPINLSAVNVTMSAPDLSKPFALDGGFVWKKEAIKLALKAQKPADLLAGKSSPLSVSLNAKPVKLNFGGSLQLGEALSAGGALDFSTPSLKGLAAWAGQPLGYKGAGLGPASVKGTLTYGGSKIGLKDATVQIDNLQGTGSIGVDTGRKVPYVAADLTMGQLDLNPYLPPEIQGGASSYQWSNETIDTSALRAVNADLNLKANQIKYRKLLVDSGAIALKLRGGKLVLNLNSLKLYGGSGTGQMVLDGGGKGMGVSQSFKLTGLQARPFMTALGNFDKISGTAALNMNTTARGRSQRSIVSSMNGGGAFQFTDGALHGFNLAEMVRNLSTAGLAKGSSKKTDFAILAGTFKITSGVLANQDLYMKSPLVRLAGKGSTDMRSRTVKYRVEPKFVADLKGQGGDDDKKGLVVPVNITGTWHNLKFTPDLLAAFKLDPSKLVKDPKAALAGIKDQLKSVKGIGKGAEGQVKDVRDAAKGFLDGFKKPKAPEPVKEEKKPEDEKKEAKKAEPPKEEKKPEKKKEEPKAEEKKEVKKADPPKEEKKPEPAKETPKAEEKKEVKKADPPKEEKKPEPAKETPKAEEKKEVKKADPPKEEKKPEPAKETPKAEEKKEVKKETETKAAEPPKEPPKDATKKAPEKAPESGEPPKEEPKKTAE